VVYPLYVSSMRLALVIQSTGDMAKVIYPDEQEFTDTMIYGYEVYIDKIIVDGSNDR